MTAHATADNDSQRTGHHSVRVGFPKACYVFSGGRGVETVVDDQDALNDFIAAHGGFSMILAISMAPWPHY